MPDGTSSPDPARQGARATGGAFLIRAAHRAAPWLLALGMFAGLLFCPRRPPYPHPANRGGDPSEALLTVLVCLAAAAAVRARRCRWPLRVVAVVGWCVASMWAPLAAAGYYTVVSDGPGRRRTIRVVGYAVVTAVLVAVPLAASWTRAYPGEVIRGALLGILLASAVGGPPLVLGLWVDARRRLLAALRARADDLEREQAVHAERARAQERARIAREMHDVVAHRVSLMVLQAGALEVSAADDLTAATSATIRATGREALAELRQLLGVLKAPLPAGPIPADASLGPQPTLADLDGLVDLTRACGIPVTVRGRRRPAALPTAVELAGFRIVQEGLANVAKHAGAVATVVELDRSDDLLSITVTNEAPAGRRPEPCAGGFGLIGLAERVEVLGGTVTAGETGDGGFRVLARIPLGRPDPAGPAAGGE